MKCVFRRVQISLQSVDMGLINEKSTLVEAVVYCRQATTDVDHNQYHLAAMGHKESNLLSGLLVSTKLSNKNIS